MDDEAKLHCVNATLHRAAESVGDVTAPVMARYYAAFPDAAARFAEHGHGAVHDLEGEMVTRVIYALMTWFESPGEIDIQLTTSVIHHADTLHVRPELYSGLIRITCEVIAETIPVACADEAATWNELCRTLVEISDASGLYA